MFELSESEINEVSGGGGGGGGQAVVTTGLISGGAAMGSYLAAARIGATFGMAAGPMGAVAGAIIGGGAAYAWFHRTAW